MRRSRHHRNLALGVLVLFVVAAVAIYWPLQTQFEQNARLARARFEAAIEQKDGAIAEARAKLKALESREQGETPELKKLRIEAAALRGDRLRAR